VTDERRTIIGVDIGASKTAVLEGTDAAAILQRSERPTDPGRPFRETWPQLTAQIDDVIAAARASGRLPRAISVAVGGPLLAREGRLLDPPNLPGWHGVALRDELVARYPDLGVYIEHDAKAGALAEFRYGAGAGRSDLRDLVFLTLGTGLGAGIIANGRLLRGSSEMAGEVWPLVVAAPDGALTTASIWELGASGRGLVLLAEQLYPGRWPQSALPAALVSAARSGDPAAISVVEECGRWLGAGMASLITILNPQLIVLGSLAVALGPILLEAARPVLYKRTRPRALEAVSIVPAALGQRLGDVQALMAAVEANV
jgi:glucokinase